MTRKDYELIASAIHRSRMADRARFLKAAGVNL